MYMSFLIALASGIAQTPVDVRLPAIGREALEGAEPADNGGSSSSEDEDEGAAPSPAVQVRAAGPWTAEATLHKFCGPPCASMQAGSA